MMAGSFMNQSGPGISGQLPGRGGPAHIDGLSNPNFCKRESGMAMPKTARQDSASEILPCCI